MSQCYSCQKIITDKNKTYFEIQGGLIYCKAKRSCVKRRNALIPAGARQVLRRLSYKPMISRAESIMCQNQAIAGAKYRKAQEEHIANLAIFD